MATFTDAQVASYIQNNALSGGDLARAASAFGIQQDQLQRAAGLLAAGSPSVAEAGQAYEAAVAGRPDLVAQNLATYNPATGTGLLGRDFSAAPGAQAGPVQTSPGLSWSLRNNITQAQYDQNIVDALRRAQASGMSDAQISTIMNQYGISADDVARATGASVADIQRRMQATPTTPRELEQQRLSQADLAARQAQDLAQRNAAWEAQQQRNQAAWAEQQRANEAAWAEQQRLNAAAQAPGQFGGDTLARNFQMYQQIPIGAQYNPAVTPGGASPYSMIMSQFQPTPNPYANFVPNTPMGGYDPGVYNTLLEQVDRGLLANAIAQAADMGGAGSAGDNFGGAGDGDAGAGGGFSGMSNSGEGGFGSIGGWAKGGLIDRVGGPNPPGKDDGLGMLQLGEYVIKKSSVDKYGKGLMDMINAGKVPAKKIKSLLD